MADFAREPWNNRGSRLARATGRRSRDTVLSIAQSLSVLRTTSGIVQRIATGMLLRRSGRVIDPLRANQVL